MTELETMERAKMYMDMLAQGIDPISGTELPEDTILNNVRLARCFFYVSGVLDKLIRNGGQVSTEHKVNFAITLEQLKNVKPSAYPVRITEFTDLVQQAVNAPNMKRPSVTKITNWLTEKGFLTKEIGPDGKSRRVPTTAGTHIGLSSQMRQSPDGEYLAVYYNTNAQQFLLDNLLGIL